jgi:malonyl-CoA decarboxylase
MAAEAVHPMSHVDDLKRRLQQSDRRVYAFLHPSLPLQPLVVLHTAVLRHVPSCMEDIHSASSGSSSAGSLDVDDGNGSRGSGRDSSSSSSSSSSSVACFYSVSLAAPGLAGVDLGNALIKTAAAALLSELPGLKTLVTLSPLPGLRAWLVTQLRQAAGSGGVVTPLLSGKEAALVLDAAESLRSSSRGEAAATQTQQPQTPAAAAAASSPGAVSSASALLALLERDAWLALPAAQLHALHQLWARLAAQYLLTQRRRGLALDPVQHFHLRCGASLLRICPA